MLGRVVAVSCVLFLSAGEALPQCDFTQRYSGQYRSTVLDIAIDGNDLWAATSYGVQLFARSVTPPRSIARVAIPGITRVVRASAGIAYALLDHAPDGRVAVVLAVAGGAVLTELTTELVPEGRLLAGPLAGTAVVIGFALVFGLVEVA